MNAVDELNFLLGIGPSRPKLPPSLQNKGYISVRTLGTGSFGQALLIFHTEKKQYFVAKHVVLANMTERQRRDAYNEIAVLQKLDHPNIVRYVECCEAFPSLYIVMEYADGGDLFTHLNKIHSAAAHPVHNAKLSAGAKGGIKGNNNIISSNTHTGLTEAQVISLFFQILMAVKYMHSRRLLHRDIKSQNIFLTRNHVVKLGDFGITTVLQNTITMASTLCGTPCYFSPELCQGQPYNNKSDIWALGVLLYELCTGKLPFESTSMKLLMREIVNKQPRRIPSAYSEALWELVQSMLRKDPAKRPDTEKLLRAPVLIQRLPDIIAHLQDSEQQVRQERERSELSRQEKHAERLQSAHMNDHDIAMDSSDRMPSGNNNQSNDNINRHAFGDAAHTHIRPSDAAPPPLLLPGERIVESDPYQSILAKQRDVVRQDGSSVYNKVNIGWCTTDRTDSDRAVQGGSAASVRLRPTSLQRGNNSNVCDKSNHTTTATASDNDKNSKGHHSNDIRNKANGVNPFLGAPSPSADGLAGYRSGVPFLRRAAPPARNNNKKAEMEYDKKNVDEKLPSVDRLACAQHVTPDPTSRPPDIQSAGGGGDESALLTRKNVALACAAVGDDTQQAINAPEKVLCSSYKQGAEVVGATRELAQPYSVAPDVLRKHVSNYTASGGVDAGVRETYCKDNVRGSGGVCSEKHTNAGSYVISKASTASDQLSLAELVDRFDREKKRIREQKAGPRQGGGQRIRREHKNGATSEEEDGNKERQSRAALRQLPRQEERIDNGTSTKNDDNHTCTNNASRIDIDDTCWQDCPAMSPQSVRHIAHAGDAALSKSNTAAMHKLTRAPNLRDAHPQQGAATAAVVHTAEQCDASFPQAPQPYRDETELSAMLREMTVHVKQFEECMGQGALTQTEEPRAVWVAAAEQESPLPCVLHDTAHDESVGESKCSGNSHSSKDQISLSKIVRFALDTDDKAHCPHHSGGNACTNSNKTVDNCPGDRSNECDNNKFPNSAVAEWSKLRVCKTDCDDRDQERLGPLIHTPPVMLSPSVSLISVPGISACLPVPFPPRGDSEQFFDLHGARLDLGELAKKSRSSTSPVFHGLDSSLPDTCDSHARKSLSVKRMHSPAILKEWCSDSSRRGVRLSLNRQYNNNTQRNHELEGRRDMLAERTPGSVKRPSNRSHSACEAKHAPEPSSGRSSTVRIASELSSSMCSDTSAEDVVLCASCLCGRLCTEVWLSSIYGSFSCSCVVCARVGKSPHGVEWLHLPDMSNAKHLLLLHRSNYDNSHSDEQMRNDCTDAVAASCAVKTRKQKVLPNSDETCDKLSDVDTRTTTAAHGAAAVAAHTLSSPAVSAYAKKMGTERVSDVTTPSRAAGLMWQEYTFTIPVVDDKDDDDAERANRTGCEGGMRVDEHNHDDHAPMKSSTQEEEECSILTATFTIYFCPACGTQLAMLHDDVKGLLLCKTALNQRSQDILAQYATPV